MSGPLYRAVQEYIAKDRARFHMPGHKGKPLPVLGDLSRWDISEVEGTDSLYEADGAIAATEGEYTRLYGSKASFLSAGGSTLCIQAMLALACPPGSSLICVRHAHTASLSAMALLDLRPVWAYPEIDPATGLTCAITPKQIETLLGKHPGVSAVYLTSPTYYGAITDVAAVSAICREKGVPLLVDDAHGAHLKFLPQSQHPVDLGADLCCDSLHKTLPVLTGGAMLHVQNNTYLPGVKRAMSLFGSTSPSYPIMLSADVALSYLQEGFSRDLRQVVSRLGELRQLAQGRGFLVPGGVTDPARLVLGSAPLGYTGIELGAHLRSCGIEPELCGDAFCVLMASPANGERDFQRLADAIVSLKAKAPLAHHHPALLQPQPVLTPRQAFFSPSEEIPLEDAGGRIAGASVCPCPPGIPLVAAGEQIDHRVVAWLKSYGISRINVLK